MKSPVDTENEEKSSLAMIAPLRNFSNGSADSNIKDGDTTKITEKTVVQGPDK